MSLALFKNFDLNQALIKLH